mmetsp:Transcript_33402/g.37333  ORF Transcript_33402/g.37333 Transcript_33402/m.37333 type:complete len:89 (-) Transcript_33402:81-347(-)
MIALTTQAVDSGAVIPRKREDGPPYFDPVANDHKLGFPFEVCIRTLSVSIGCPTTTDAEPATPPAIKSLKKEISCSFCGGVDNVGCCC